MSLIRCQQDGCQKLTPPGAYTVNGKVSCQLCYEMDQSRRLRDDDVRKYRRKIDYEGWDQ